MRDSIHKAVQILLGPAPDQKSLDALKKLEEHQDEAAYIDALLKLPDTILTKILLSFDFIQPSISFYAHKADLDNFEQKLWPLILKKLLEAELTVLSRNDVSLRGKITEQLNKATITTEKDLIFEFLKMKKEHPEIQILWNKVKKEDFKKFPVLLKITSELFAIAKQTTQSYQTDLMIPKNTVLGLLQPNLYRVLLLKDCNFLDDICNSLFELPNDTRNNKKELFHYLLNNYPQIAFYLQKDPELKENDPANLAKAKLSQLTQEFLIPDQDGFSLIPVTSSEKNFCIAPLIVAIKKIKSDGNVFKDQTDKLARAFEFLYKTLKEEVDKDPSKVVNAQKIALEHFKMIQAICKPGATRASKLEARNTCLENCSRTSARQTVLKVVAHIAEFILRLFTPAPLPKSVREKLEVNSPLSPAYSRAGLFVSPKVDEQAKEINEILRSGPGG